MADNLASGIRLDQLKSFRSYNTITIQQLVPRRSGSRFNPGSADWSTPGLNVSGHDFVELQKGDPDMQSFFVGSRAYSTSMSLLIKELCEIQAKASKTELGDEDGQRAISVHRQRSQMRALRILQEGTPAGVVEVVLPSFTSRAGETIAAVNTVMPLNVAPTKAMLKINAEVLTWTVIRADSIVPPEKQSTTAKGARDKRMDNGKKRQKVSQMQSSSAKGEVSGDEPDEDEKDDGAAEIGDKIASE